MTLRSRRTDSRVTRACRIAERPPRTSLTQRASAAGTSAGIADLLRIGAERLADLAELDVGHQLGLELVRRLGLAGGNTRKVDSLTADQPELSSTIDRIGSLYCCATANTEHGLPK